MKIRIACGLKSCIYGMVLFILFFRFFEDFGLPHSAVFVLDGVNLLFFLNLIISKRIKKYLCVPLVKWQTIMILVGILISMSFMVSPIHVLWSLRNLLRFIVFYIACAEYLSINDVDMLFALLEKVFWLNFVLFLTEFFFFNLRGDYLGGIFGTKTGSNAYLNIFLLVIMAYEIALWLNKKVSTAKLCAYLGTALVECALCELKVFFIEAVLLLGILIFMDLIVRKRIGFLKRLFFLAFMLVLMVTFTNYIMGIIYPNFADFFTVQELVEHTTRPGGYSNSGDLNRLTFFKTINETLFLKPIQRVFGMGLGSAEYSSAISILMSPIYKQYNHWRYYWFSSAWMYLECGYIGMFLYLFGFFSEGLLGLRYAKRVKEDPKQYGYRLMSSSLCAMAFVLFLYNQSLRLEIAYLLYLSIAVGHIGGNSTHGRK